MSDFRYLLQTWKTANPRSIAFAVLRVPVLIALPLLMSLVPKLILDCIARQTSCQTFTFVVLGVSFAIACLRWLDSFLQSKINFAAQQFRTRATIQTMRKLLTMDYALLEKPETRQKIEAAQQFAFKGRFSKSQFFCDNLTLFCASCFGVFSFVAFLTITQTCYVNRKTAKNFAFFMRNR